MNAVFYTRLDGVGAWVSASIPTVTGLNSNSEEVEVTPVVWYCTDPDFSVSDISSIVVDEEHGWTRTEPVGQIVYGLITDYSKDSDGNSVVYSGDLNLPIYIYEKNMCFEERQFTSETVLTSDSSWQAASVNGGVMTGTVEYPDLSISISSTPVSGTEDDPMDVFFEEDLIYEVTIRNDGDRAVQNVHVTLDVPESVTCDLSTVTIGGVPITESPKVSNPVIENGKLSFTINTLHSGDVLTVMENTWVNTHTSYVVITNTGVIDSYNDMVLPDDLKVTSNTTYHITLNVPDPTGIRMSPTSWLCLLGLGLCGLVAVNAKRKEEI